MRPPFSSGEPDPLELGPPAPAAKKATPRKRSAPTPVGELLADALPDRPPGDRPSPRSAPAKKTTARKAPSAKKETAREPLAAPPPSASAPPQPAEVPVRPPREPGPVEAATVAELTAAALERTALAASCIAMARNVDEAETASGASSAARELRMTLPLALSSRKALSPPAEGEGDAKSTVVPPNRLTALRSKAERRAR